MPLRNPGGDDFVEISFRLSLTFIFSGPTWKTFGKIVGPENKTFLIVLR